MFKKIKAYIGSLFQLGYWDNEINVVHQLELKFFLQFYKLEFSLVKIPLANSTIISAITAMERYVECEHHEVVIPHTYFEQEISHGYLQNYLVDGGGKDIELSRLFQRYVEACESFIEVYSKGAFQTTEINRARASRFMSNLVSLNRHLLSIQESLK